MTGDDGNPQLLSAEQCREQGNRIRRVAETMSGADVRRQLRDVADQYDRLADSMDRSRWG
jgi:hypothetical protein